MLKFAPILIAVIYGYTMYRFSAWRTKSNLDKNSTVLDDKPLRHLTDKMAKWLIGLGMITRGRIFFLA